jgi:hypothetical protein
MTEIEKAKELVNKFEPFVYCYSGSGMLTNTIDKEISLNFAKECALISVDEILNVDCVDMSEDAFDKHIEYWERVKTEIKNLV